MSKNRREFLKHLAGLGAFGALAAVGSPNDLWAKTNSFSLDNATTTRKKIIIIGAGLAGIATAWFLEKDYEVVVLERNSFLGGHAQTLTVDYQHGQKNIDIGAQFIAPSTHPNYFKLLKQINLITEDLKNSPNLLEKAMTMTFFNQAEKHPRFVSPLLKGRAWPLFCPHNAKGISSFAKFRKQAINYEKQNPDGLLNAEDWINSLDMSAEGKEDVALALFSTTNGCSYAEAKKFSARIGMAFVSRSFPKSALKPTLYYNLTTGLGGAANKLASLCTETKFLSNVTINAHQYRRGTHFLMTSAGEMKADYLIFSCPPHQSKNILERTQSFAPLHRLLSQFEYFPSEITIHRDPIYMPHKKKNWSVYNVELTNERAEASVWYNQFWNSKENLFKSWTANRAAKPRDIVGERKFLHPLITPDFIRAQSGLRNLQGLDNIFFSGSYTHDVDGQDTALMSAVHLAKILAPENSRLAPYLA